MNVEKATQGIRKYFLAYDEILNIEQIASLTSQLHFNSIYNVCTIQPL